MRAITLTLIGAALREHVRAATDRKAKKMRNYALEYSRDGYNWRSVTEKRTRLDCQGSGLRSEPVTRQTLQDIQREAEFHSHRYPHVRIVHPNVAA